MRDEVCEKKNALTKMVRSHQSMVFHFDRNHSLYFQILQWGNLLEFLRANCQRNIFHSDY